MRDCIFCKIISKEIPAKIFYEDEGYLAFLNIAPNTRGHSLVIPKKHSPSFAALSSAEAASLNAVVHQVATKLMGVLGVKDFNLGLNNGALSGQSIEHVHWHIIPRYLDDGLVHWEKSPQAVDTIDEVFELINSQIK